MLPLSHLSRPAPARLLSRAATAWLHRSNTNTVSRPLRASWSPSLPLPSGFRGLSLCSVRFQQPGQDDDGVFNIPKRQREPRREQEERGGGGGGGWGGEGDRYGEGGGRGMGRGRDRGGGFREEGGYGGERRFRSLDYDENEEFGSKLKPVDWSQGEPRETKNDTFYHASEAVEARSEAEVAAFYEQHDISFSQGHPMPKPILSMEEAQWNPKLLEVLSKRGFESPMPIQSASWPVALSGHDLVGIGQTGSGKTLAFLLPALMHIQNQPPLRPGHGPIAMVLAPTRELAQQIEQVVKMFTGREVRSVCLFGGASKGRQISHLDKGAHIIIATPGRLIDLLSDDYTNLRRTTYVVMDEADRMLDMGFEPQIRKILAQVRPDRQMLMFSATWPQEVKSLARDFFGKDEYVHLNIGSSELSANHDIKQVVDVLEHNGEKRDRLDDVMMYLQEQHGSDSKVLIFCQTKRTVDMVERLLRRNGTQAIGIHGDKTQVMRDQALSMFRSGRKNVLVATDIAARGLDVDDISFVINYDFPNQIEDYVHRIGRTGRRGKKGVSYTFFSEEEDSGLAKQLVEVLDEAKQVVTEDLRTIARTSRQGKKKQGGKKGSRGGGGGYKRGGFSSRDRYQDQDDYDYGGYR